MAQDDRVTLAVDLVVDLDAVAVELGHGGSLLRVRISIRCCVLRRVTSGSRSIACSLSARITEMKFGPVPLDEAAARILGHNVTGDGGRRLLRKGRALSAHDIDRLRELGRRLVYVAVPEAGDVDEDAAALRVSRAVVGDGIRLQGPSTGRVNLYATAVGVVRVDVAALERLNQHDGITLATLAAGSAVGEGKMVGTTKILPYAIAESAVLEVESEAAGRPAILRVDALPPRRAGLVLAGSRGAEERVVSGFRGGLEPRLHALGSTLDACDYVVLEEESGAEALGDAIERQPAPVSSWCCSRARRRSWIATTSRRARSSLPAAKWSASARRSIPATCSCSATSAACR